MTRWSGKKHKGENQTLTSRQTLAFQGAISDNGTTDIHMWLWNQTHVANTQVLSHHPQLASLMIEIILFSSLQDIAIEWSWWKVFIIIIIIIDFYRKLMNGEKIKQIWLIYEKQNKNQHSAFVIIY